MGERGEERALSPRVSRQNCRLVQAGCAHGGLDSVLLEGGWSMLGIGGWF